MYFKMKTFLYHYLYYYYYKVCTLYILKFISLFTTLGEKLGSVRDNQKSN